MSLFDKENIVNFNRKIKEKSIYIGGRIKEKSIYIVGQIKEKLIDIVERIKKIKVKSIYIGERIDIFLILAMVVLIITPLIINLSFKKNTETKQVNLFLSSRCEELFGREITKMLLQEFEEKNPDLRVQLLDIRAVPPAETDNSRTGKKGSQTEEKPKEIDIFLFDDEDFSALVAADDLMELNSFTNYESGNRQLAVPLVSFMDLLFYNIEILSAAGFDRPPKTREEFTAYAKTVSKGELPGVFGTALSLSPRDHNSLLRDIFSWIWAAGGNFWTEEGGPTINTRAIINDISFLGSLYREEALAPGIFNKTGADRIEEFAQGRTAMIIASTRNIPHLREKMGDGAFGITTIPVPDASGKYSIGLSAIYAGINADSAHPDEAWSFLEFLVGKIPLFCTELKAVPGAVSELIPGDYVKEDLVFYSKAWDIFESSRVLHGFSGQPDAEKYETAFLEELRIFFETERTAQATVTAIQNRWDEISMVEEK